MGGEEELRHQKAPESSMGASTRSRRGTTETGGFENWSDERPLDLLLPQHSDETAEEFWLNDEQQTSLQPLAVSQSPVQPQRKHQRGPLAFRPSGLRPHCIHPNHQPLS